MAHLTQQQRLALAALATGANPTSAAQEAGVSRWTLRRWLRKPGFRQALEVEEAETLELVRARLRAAAMQAIEGLEAVLIEGDSPPAEKIKAASALLAAWLRVQPARRAPHPPQPRPPETAAPEQRLPSELSLRQLRALAERR